MGFDKTGIEKYSGTNLYYATSVDGINFSDPVVLLSSYNWNENFTKLSNPYLMKDGNKWKLWFNSVYTGVDNIISYTEFEDKEISLFYTKKMKKLIFINQEMLLFNLE